MGLNIGNIDPQTIQKLLFGGPQAAMFPQDPAAPPPAPAPAPDASQRGSIAASMSQQAPPQELPQTPAPEQSTTPPTTASSQPPQNAPIPQAPQPYKHGTLAKIMLGIGEAVGNPLATHIGERDRARQQEIDEYGRNLPATQYQANVGQQKTKAELLREQAQTSEANATVERTHYEMGKEQQTAKANAISQIMQEVESGKYGTGEDLVPRWRRIAAANPHLGLTDEDIQGAVAGTHPLGAKYTVIKGENGRPEGLQDRAGNQYGPEQIPNEPEAQTLWQAAAKGHEQARGEKRQDEAYVAGVAADRQAAAFSNTQKAEGQKNATTHLGEMRDAQNQLQLVNQLANSKSPTDQTSLAFKALGLDLPEGVHRINDTELRAIQNQGSLSDRAYRAILNWKSGQAFAPEILEDIKGTAQKIASSKIKAANDKLEDINRVYGYKAPGSGETGRFEESAAGGGTQGSAAPKGATHTGIGSQDKKKHWLDAQGNDLGLAE